MASFLLDVHVSNLIAGRLEAGGHAVERALHRVTDDEVVARWLEIDAILVTHNRQAFMCSQVERGLEQGIRVFSLPSLNQLKKRTRLRIESELAHAMLSLCESASPFVCQFELDSSRHRLAGHEFLHGGMP